MGESMMSSFFGKFAADRPAEQTGKVPIKVHLTRDMTPGDDPDEAPFDQVLTITCEPTALALAERILAEKYLPTVSSNKAAWVIAAPEPVAVYAQEWPAPAFLHPHSIELIPPMRQNLPIRIHFCYIGETPPETALYVLRRCTFDAYAMDPFSAK